MIDPRRLRDSADRNVGELLRAGRADGPRDASGDKRRVLGALAALDNASFAEAGTKPGSSRWVRAAVAGVGLVVLGTLTVLSTTSNNRATSIPLTAPLPSSSAPSTSGAPAATVLPSIDVQALPSAEVVPNSSAMGRVLPAPKPAESVASTTATDELAAVERVRTQLKAGDATGARKDLVLYRATFSQGRFVEEIDALDVETLIAEGASASARTKAAEFLSHYPSSPYARRVRSLIAAIDKAEAP